MRFLFRWVRVSVFPGGCCRFGGGRSVFGGRLGFIQEAAAAEHRPLVGVLAAEVAVHGHAVLRAASGEYLAAEVAGDLLVEQVAALAEGLEGVLVEHLGPGIEIVAKMCEK